MRLFLQEIIKQDVFVPIKELSAKIKALPEDCTLADAISVVCLVSGEVTKTPRVLAFDGLELAKRWLGTVSTIVPADYSVAVVVTAYSTLLVFRPAGTMADTDKVYTFSGDTKLLHRVSVSPVYGACLTLEHGVDYSGTVVEDTVGSLMVGYYADGVVITNKLQPNEVKQNDQA